MTTTETPRRNARQEYFDLGRLQLEDGKWRVTNGMHATAWMPTKEQARSRWARAYGAINGHVHLWETQGTDCDGQRQLQCADCGDMAIVADE